MNNSHKKTPDKNKKTILKVTQPDELLKFLFCKLSDRSRKSIKSLLSHKQITVDNDIITQFDYLLKLGQEVTINSGKEIYDDKIKGLKILFEDLSLIVINKEAGLLSIATDSEKEKTAYKMLSDHVKKKEPENKIFVIHRLDKDTSGVMMYAKNSEVRDILQDNWKKIVKDRIYVAVVEGSVEKENGTVTSWLKENKSLIMYSSRNPGDGQKAITSYRVIKRNNNYSLLEVKLETGRKNQIRVHMKDIGHSIIGDKKYGSTKNPIKRLGLHAHILSFIHPVSEKEMRFETDIPEEFKNLFKKSKSLLANK